MADAPQPPLAGLPPGGAGGSASNTPRRGGGGSRPASNCGGGTSSLGKTMSGGLAARLQAAELAAAGKFDPGEARDVLLRCVLQLAAFTAPERLPCVSASPLQTCGRPPPLRLHTTTPRLLQQLHATPAWLLRRKPHVRSASPSRWRPRASRAVHTPRAPATAAATRRRLRLQRGRARHRWRSCSGASQSRPTNHCQWSTQALWQQQQRAARELRGSARRATAPVPASRLPQPLLWRRPLLLPLLQHRHPQQQLQPH